jgi:hypothetical protein
VLCYAAIHPSIHFFSCALYQLKMQCAYLLSDVMSADAWLVSKVIAPSAADLATRQSRLETRELPPVEEWRMTPAAGCLLSESSQVVRSNHFLVNTRHIPARFFQYHLHLHAFDGQSGELREEDIASKEDFRVTVALVAQFRDLHPEFAEVAGQRVGFVYDNRNCVVATQELPLPDVNKNGEPCVTDELCLVNPDGTPSRKRFRLTLSYAATGRHCMYRGVDGCNA